MVVAVRKASGAIKTASLPIAPWSERLPLLKWPFLRGAAGIFETIGWGYRALNFSADEAFDDIDAEQEAAGKQGLLDGEGVQAVLGVLANLLATAIAIGLFLYLPVQAAELLRVNGVPLDTRLAYNGVEGAVRLLVLVGYIVAVSLNPMMHRLFMYHGAEHKAINAFEAGLELTPETTRDQPIVHYRCGTTFLLMVILLKVVIFTVVPLDLPVWQKVAARLALLPVVAGVAYEVLRWTANHSGNILARVLAAPGLLMQRLTTRRPTDDQLEVAIAALECALDHANAPSAKAA